MPWQGEIQKICIFYSRNTNVVKKKYQEIENFLKNDQ